MAAVVSGGECDDNGVITNEESNMNFIKAHEQAIVFMAIGLLLAGFISDVKWNVLARAVGVL